MGSETGSSIVLASSLKELESLATRISKSNLVPVAYRGQPDDIYVAMLMGNELGVGPMQSLNNIDVVEGRAQSRSRLKKVLATKHPACEYFKMIESTPEKATYETKKRGDPEPTRLTYTIAQATAAGLTRKTNWMKHPAEMLRARCEGQLADIVYADSTLGLPPDEYSEDDASVIAEPVQATAGVVDVTPAAPVVTKGTDALKATLEQKKTEAKNEAADVVKFDKKPDVQDVELKEEKKTPAPTPPGKSGAFTVEKNEDGSETLRREKKKGTEAPKTEAPKTEAPKTEASPAATASTTPPPAAGPSDEAYEKCLALSKLKSIPPEVLKAKLKEVGAKGPKSVTEEHYKAIAKMYAGDAQMREPGDDREEKEGDLF